MESKETLIRAVTHQLWRILNKHSRVEEHPFRFEQEIVLTPKEIHTVQAIGEREPINLTEVATHFGVTKSAASQMVAKLTEKGFVQKEFAAHSNKEYGLSLTKLGWKAFDAHSRVHGKHWESLLKRLSRFSNAQIEITSGVLTAIEKTVDEHLEKK